MTLISVVFFPKKLFIADFCTFCKKTKQKKSIMVPDFALFWLSLVKKKKKSRHLVTDLIPSRFVAIIVSSWTMAMAELGNLVYYGKNVQYGSVKYLMLNLNRKLLKAMRNCSWYAFLVLNRLRRIYEHQNAHLVFFFFF